MSIGYSSRRRPNINICHDRTILQDEWLKLMFRSSLPPVVCMRTYVLFTLFVFVYLYVVSNTYCVVCWFFFLSLSCVLCTKCCLFLRIVHSWWLPHWYSLMFISYTWCIFCKLVLVKIQITYCLLDATQQTINIHYHVLLISA